MPEFEIVVNRTFVTKIDQTAEFTIEAASEEEARKRAQEMLDSQDETIPWEDWDTPHEDEQEDAYITNVEKLEELDQRSRDISDLMDML